MGNSFFTYIQRLELIGFFAGYPLLYTLILVFAANKQIRDIFKNRLVSILPLSYALVGTLYLGLQIKNLYLSQTINNINNPFLMGWALLAILFWLPSFRKKEWWSLLHSLAFFFLLVKDIIMQFSSSADEHILKNDMKIYTVSLLLNLGCFIFLLLFSFIICPNKKGANSNSFHLF